MTDTAPHVSGPGYWAAERYQAIADRLAPISERLCDAAGLNAGDEVLDIGTATGNAALASARRACRVTAIDTDTAMLDVGRRRAEAAGLDIDFQQADAQHLPYANATCDVVLSAYGAMFAPDTRRTATELLRVCRPAGRIALAHWTPESAITAMFETLHRYHPATTGLLDTACQWATPAGLHDLFGPTVTIDAHTQNCLIHTATLYEWITILFQTFGPARLSLAAITRDEATRLRNDLTDVFGHVSRTSDGTCEITVEYLLATITPEPHQ